MPAKKTNAIGDEAVKKATGRDWNEWLKVLDREGAQQLEHRAIVDIVHSKYGIGPWWGQMVTVGYEQRRGMRELHQKTTGYSASISRTLPVAVDDLFAAWSDGRRRAKWLREPKLTIRKSTPNKSLRITWSDGASNVEVNFYPKGDAKTQISVQHDKLASKDDVAAKKELWSAALARLKESFERA